MSRPHCRALTADGQPCRNFRLNAEGLCWRHDGRPKPTYRPRVPSDAPKTCRVCGLLRPARHFNVGPTNPKTGIAYRKTICRDCAERERRSRGVPERHARYNHRSDVWCNNCKHYLPAARFKRHPLRPHTYWAYCRECTRTLDRMRYRAKAKTAAGKAAQSARIERRRRERQLDQAERRRFVRDAIALLRQRGLTKSDIGRIARVSIGSLLDWERAKRRPDPSIADRFAVLLRETADLPLGATPSYRRRKPHPDLEVLIARCAPDLDRYPIRTAWKQTPLGPQR